MKNCFFLKFLALLLCAASLMGIIGGAAGALVLAEGDLYHKTVEEVMAQRVQQFAGDAAVQLGLHYADQVLGGCPDEIVRYPHSNLLSRNFTTYGYAILDEDGHVLQSLNPELKNSTPTYSVPVTGQYMHLVSLQTESQAKEEAARKRLDIYGNAMTDADGELIPVAGIPINHVIFTGQDGHILYEASCSNFTGSSTYYYRDYLLDNGVVDSFANSYDHMNNAAGYLFYNISGELTYASFLKEGEKAFQTTVYGVFFHNGEQNFTFQADNAQGIGVLSNETGALLFTSFAAKQEAAEPENLPAAAAVKPDEAAVPETRPEETAPETVEETAAETVEETTAATETTTESTEETQAATQETQAETEETREPQREPSSASAPPEGTGTHSSNSQNQTDSNDQISRKTQERILAEWLLSQGLITEEELPAEMISDELFREALIYYQLIDTEQTFPAVSEKEPVREAAGSAEAAAEATAVIPSAPILINGRPLESYQVNQADYMSSATQERTIAKYVYLPMPALTVEIYAAPEALQDAATYDALKVLRQFRDTLLPLIGISLLLFVLTGIYLLTAAGRRPNTEEVRASGINRLPLDLYLCLGSAAGLSMAALAAAGAPSLLSRDFALGCSLAAASAFTCCLIFTGFCFAFAAQVKTGGGMWWRNTLSVRFVFLFMVLGEKFRLWLADTFLPWLFRLVKKLWQLTWKILVRVYEAVEKITARTGEKLNRFFSLIPMTWQWLLGGLTIILLALLVNTGHVLLILMGILIPIAIVLYVTHCFGVLSESIRKMGKGNLDTKVEDKFMAGCFQDFANDLNDLADVAMVAAQKQLKSERMKTELITNVSHDIKTPLTSIINYVDLLQKPHTEEQAEQYLDVLDRQSQRLKKLVDDLMDMSKASTGNMAVEITRLDMVESVNQALGEFSDKLERAQLYPVFRHSEASFPIMADGKLVWRVLSNVLSNAVKYAMPKTRIYLDLTHVNGQVILSLKNISREPLNVTAEELMERFVRGDVSRNTEGSGLGLNIAKSLMELQKGQLQILVDGDLFKVTLIFPDTI